MSIKLNTGYELESMYTDASKTEVASFIYKRGARADFQRSLVVGANRLSKGLYKRPDTLYFKDNNTGQIGGHMVVYRS